MMRTACIVVVAFVAFAVGVPTHPAPAPPSFPGQYTIRGTFRIPYFNVVEPISVFNDEANDRQRVEYFGGQDTTLVLGGKVGMSYEIVPRIDHMICMQSNISGPTSTGGSASSVSLPPFLPDISTWKYIGVESVRDFDCDTWELQVKNFTKTATYRMYTEVKSGSPVQLVLDGLNFIHGSHPDLYIMEYDVYIPSVDAASFEVPDICKTKEVDYDSERVGARIKATQSRYAKIFPPRHVCGESHEFRAFALQHGKHYGSCDEMTKKQSVWEKNAMYIETHNAKPDRHKLKMNHFGDWTDDEFRLLMLQRRGRAADSRATQKHLFNENDIVPEHLDWRSSGVVTKVKDQLTCGSCWTFGVTGSLEGVYALKHKKLVSVSEQQLVDCAWGYTWSGPGGNQACDGGFGSAAFQWMIDNGGVATEESYPYIGQDGWCNARDHSANIKVTGYANVSSIAELRHALATAGPVAVAIDASHPSFRFYASGVYYEPLCKSDMDDLDHEVLAVGYGHEDGQDYTIIKNSWSTYWGDEGYVKMSSKDNNCGVGTQGNYPFVA